MNESMDNWVFPVDGDDTTDTVEISIDHTGETANYPRLWQTSDGVFDLGDTFRGLVDQREDAKRQLEQVRAYYDGQVARTRSILSKVRTAITAFEAHDDEMALAALASLTPAEQADMAEQWCEMLDEHPEWALADVGDADEDGDHD